MPVAISRASSALPLHRVRIHTPLVGGGFGGKSYCKMEPLVALMARKARRPCASRLVDGWKHPHAGQASGPFDLHDRRRSREAASRRGAPISCWIEAPIPMPRHCRRGQDRFSDRRRLSLAGDCQPRPDRSHHHRSFRICSGGFGGTRASFASERQIDLIARRGWAKTRSHFACAIFSMSIGRLRPGDRGMDSDLRRRPCRMSPTASDIRQTPARPRHRLCCRSRRMPGGPAITRRPWSAQTQDGEVDGQRRRRRCRAGRGIGLVPHCDRRPRSCRSPMPPMRRSIPITVRRTTARMWSCGTLVTGRAIEQAAMEVRNRSKPSQPNALIAMSRRSFWKAGRVRRGNVVHPLAPMVRKYYGGIGWEFIGRGAFKEPYDPDTPMGARNISWMPCWSAAEVSVDDETGACDVAQAHRQCRSRPRTEPRSLSRADRRCGDAGAGAGDVRGVALSRCRAGKCRRR